MSLRFAPRVLRALIAAALLACCQQQGEGAPCDPLAGNSGNDDCQSNLVCKTISTGVARCCPATGTSNSPDCSGFQGAPDANPAPVDVITTVDSGADATVPDGGAEASSGGEAAAPADSSTDSSTGG
jgi:hypothetical protein